ncbi:MAG TPA: GTPase ObgE, partial [Candidatus Nitrosotenuis sp.]|nr:GTPase ObgE [Candidatus Nitrosotenuis sp.]
TLADFSRRCHFRAPDGGHGQGDNKTGPSAEDLVLPVPVGTMVFDSEGRCLADLARAGQRALVARGGRGGRGNARFATPRRQAPTFYEKGEPGEERWLVLDLRLVAEVGIIGLPNAGKSTLLSRISRADPKIADYPFTTLNPVLGVVRLPPTRPGGAPRRAVFADIPGLIEGASRGAGLGHEFLRHVARTRLLLHLLDLGQVDPADPLRSYRTIRDELAAYDARLLEREEIVAANKIDLPASGEALACLRAALGDRPLYPISARDGQGLEELLEATFAALEKAPAPEPPRSELPPVAEDTGFLVRRQGDCWVVSGRLVERAVAMTDLDAEEPTRRLQARLLAWGVEDELLRAGARAGDTVRIGKAEFEFTPEPVRPSLPQGPEVRPSQKARLEEKRARRQSVREQAQALGRGRGRKRRP